MAGPLAAPRWKLRLRAWGYLLLVVVLSPIKAASLLVPRRRDLVLLGAGGQHIDNLLGILMARPAPTGLRIVVLASRRHHGDARLGAAVAALPNAKLVGKASLAAVWACLRAGWVLVPATRLDVWRFWLGRARLVYVNHGPWIKRMEPTEKPSAVNRAWTWLFGRYRLVLAAHPGEVADYQAWLGKGVEVLDLGYPRSALLEQQRKQGVQPGKVALWPTWKGFDDPSYGPGLARRLHEALLARGWKDACIDYRPHPLSGERPLLLGHDDGRRAALVVTDFSSVAFDQFYRGARVLLYSRRLDDYVASRGLRSDIEAWLRKNIFADPDALLARIERVLAGKDPGAPDPLHLKAFSSASFWKRLHDG